MALSKRDFTVVMDGGDGVLTVTHIEATDKANAEHLVISAHLDISYEAAQELICTEYVPIMVFDGCHQESDYD